MIRIGLFMLAAGSMLTSSVVRAGPSTTADARAELPIEWMVSPASEAGKVQFTLRYSRRPGQQSTTSRPVGLAELQGLREAQLRGSGLAAFHLVRPAGTLACSGDMDGGRGIGTCRFRADSRFTAELRRQRYPEPTAHDLVAAAINGLTPDFVRDMSEAGYRPGSIDRVVEFHIQGVTPLFVRELAAADPNLVRLQSDDLTHLRVHGVTPQFVRDMTELGYRDLAVRDLVAMRIHGVSSDWVRQLHRAGIRPATAEELVDERIHRRR